MVPAPVHKPLSLAERHARAAATAPALRRRVASLAYDAVLLFGVVFMVGIAFAVSVHQTHGLLYRQYLIGVVFVALAIYFGGFWSRQGQTLAGRTWHLQIVQPDGSLPTLMQAVWRYTLAWLWVWPGLGMGFALHQLADLPRSVSLYMGVLAAWTLAYALLSRCLPQRQFLHDLLAGTRIIDTRTNS